MGPTWVLRALDWPHVGSMNLAIRGDDTFATDNNNDSIQNILV